VLTYLNAIAQALGSPELEILAMNVTQWESGQWVVDNTMENSFRLNSFLMSCLKKSGPVISNPGAKG